MAELSSRDLKRLVVPFYMEMLHGNILGRTEREQARWLKRFHRTALRIDEATARALLDGFSWREHMVGAWFIGVRRWDHFADRLSSLLLASELTYQGQGLSVGLALLSTDAAAEGLDAYLTEWLPVLDARYDQPWAMAALTVVDEHRGMELCSTASAGVESMAISRSQSGDGACARRLGSRSGASARRLSEVVDGRRFLARLA